MISYKLAKKLKDAGFPKREKMPEGIIIDPDLLEDKMTKIKFDCIYPTLSELIEACGEDFGRLDQFPNCWEAEGGKLINIKHCSYEYLTQGKTPEEAVAKLWLKLNAKPNKKS